MDTAFFLCHFPPLLAFHWWRKTTATTLSRSGRISFRCADTAYSGRLIASFGQTEAHVPHSVQRSGLIEYFSPSEIAPAGHSSIHVPHAMQSSLITYAIMFRI